jgi:hypothetical protein
MWRCSVVRGIGKVIVFNIIMATLMKFTRSGNIGSVEIMDLYGLTAQESKPPTSSNTTEA